MRIVLFFSAWLFVSLAFADTTVEDMVLVQTSHGNHILIDIFETSCEKAQNLKYEFCTWGSIKWKPARMNFAQAQEVCEMQGKRLPTREEWLSAASNMGQNTTYTLASDSLYENGQLLVNLKRKGKGSLPTTDFQQLGIDGVGTVGMTGNRTEFVVDGDNIYQCGGEYETQDTDDVKLGKICWPHNSSRTSTSRCVLDYDDSIQVNYSDFVTGELLEYIGLLAITVGLDELLIPENQYTKMVKKDERILRPSSYDGSD